MDLTQPKLEISEDDLHAYVDGTLDRADRLTVALYLAAHPTQAARVEAFRAQREALRSLYADVVDEPLPRALKRELRLRASALRRRLLIVAAATTGGLVLLAGGTLAQHLAAVPAAPIAAAPAPAHDAAPPVVLPVRRGSVGL